MSRMLSSSAALVAAAALVAPQAVAQSQPTTGPVATYWMTARTTAGLPGMGGGGFNPVAMMSGGGGAQKALTLQLQSDRSADAPEAEHVPPSGLATGILPLVTPRHEPAPAADPTQTWADGGDGGNVRMLIYHGCGDATGAGQPLVVEISSANPTAGANRMAELMNAVSLRAETPPSPGAGRTYGDWPNARSSQQIPTHGSLVGDHLIRGNYTPDINFSLGADQDFMGEVRLTGVEPGQTLGWNDVSGARGYFATTMGSNEAGDMVAWTSSAIPIGFGFIPDTLSPADLERLISRGVVLPATTTQCAIPSAVQQAAPQSMLRVIAFGGEADFAYPPRPANRRQAWNIEHVVKVRYTSSASTMLGMDMSGFDDARAEDQSRSQPVPGVPVPGVAEAARSILGGLGGALRRRR